MKKNSAWTLMEMIVAIAIISILSGFMLSTINIDVSKAKLFMYASIKNLENATAIINDQFETFHDQANTGSNDWLCMKLADIFTIEDTINCTATTSGSANVNFVLPTGVSFQGLANAWLLPYTGALYYYKDIVVDINGTAGKPNKVWVDRFPMRIYSGSEFTGQVRVSNCAGDTFDNEGAAVGISSSAVYNPYCKNDSTNVRTETAMDNKVITYDVFAIEESNSEEDENNTVLVASGRSFVEAECLAYGGDYLVSTAKCASAGYKVHDKCLSLDTCAMCGNNSAVCSSTATTQEACETLVHSRNYLGCYVNLHRPSSGGGFFVDMVVNEAQML